HDHPRPARAAGPDRWGRAGEARAALNSPRSNFSFTLPWRIEPIFKEPETMARWTIGLVGMFILLAAAGCSDSETAAQDRKKPRDEFAADQAREPAKMIAFDGKQAMSYLEEICKIGPRISGSAGMKKQQELLKEHFEKRGGKVAWQKFTAKQFS